MSTLHQAGIQQGMLIAQVGGQSIHNIQDLEAVLEDYQPGETIDLSVLNANGQLYLQSVHLGIAPGH